MEVGGTSAWLKLRTEEEYRERKKKGWRLNNNEGKSGGRLEKAGGERFCSFLVQQC